MDKKIYIDNCEYSFEYKCPLEWKNLKKTKDSKIRFCGECDKNVYRCTTNQEIDENIKLNHCIAIDRTFTQPPTMGVMEPPEYPKDLKKDKIGNTVFLGCMFIGVGIGYLIGNFLAGASIGMGVGFLSRLFLKTNKDEGVPF